MDELYEEHLIEVRDVDTEYFRDVRVYLDRGMDLFHFPKESVDRLGEPDEEGSGNYWLIDGRVEARAEEIEVGGKATPVWTVPVNQLVTRPAARRG